MDKDQILQKYEPAMSEMQRQQVNVSEVRMQGDKLYVLAFAPSQEAKNKVWDQIKAVDPNYADLICDIRVGSEQQVHSEFDEVAKTAGAGSLAHGLAEAFRSDRTPPFSQMLGHLFGQSSGEQKAGLLNQLFAVTPSSLASEVLGKFGVGGGTRQITPQQAEKIPPEAVQQLAERAEHHDPSVIDRVSSFYSEHPNLVTTLGVGALTVLTSKIIGGLRGKSGA